MAQGTSAPTIDGRPAAPAAVQVVRVRTVAALSVARLMKLALLWAGIPVGAIALATGAVEGPAGDAVAAWFYAGAAMLAANASGLVTVRVRRKVPVEGG